MAGAITLVSQAITSASVNLSTTTGSGGEALADYANWTGATSSNTPDIRKSGGGSLITAITPTGTTPVGYTNDPRTISWTSNGTPTASGSDTGGVYYIFDSGSDSIYWEMPAGVGDREVRIYTSIYNTRIKFTLSLGDSSASPVSTTLPVDIYEQRLIVFKFRANSAGQTARITAVDDASATGNVAIQAIWLSVETGSGNIYNSSITESITSTDSPSATTTRPSSITESITATESSNAQGVLTRNITESIAATEVQSARAVFNGVVTEPISLADSPSARLTIPSAITEAASLSDSSSSSIGGSVYNSSIAESVTGSELSSSQLIGNSIITESMSLASAESASSVFAAQINEAINANATHPASTVAIGSAIESLALLDSPSSRLTASAGISEAISISDSPNGGLTRASAIAEAVTATESSSSISAQIYNVSITEPVTASEQITVSVIKKLAKRVIGGAISLREGVGNLIRRNIGSNLTERDE